MRRRARAPARCADARDALLALRATAVLHRLLHGGCAGADADALRRKAAWLLLFMLCEDGAHRSQLRASHGEHVVLEVCLFAASPERADPALRVAGLFGLQKLSARSAAIRRYLGEGDALRMLVATVARGGCPADADALALMALHALPNAPSEARRAGPCAAPRCDAARRAGRARAEREKEFARRADQRAPT